METPLQSATRLLAALGELVTQEAAVASADDHESLVELQLRAGEITDRLVALAPDPAVATLQPQVAELLERRRQTRAMLVNRLAGVRQEIERLRATRLRLERVAPVYGAGAAAAPRFNAAA